MGFSLKPDFDTTQERFNAFWEREIIDRPPVSIILPKKTQKEIPQKSYDNLEQRWMDIDFRAETMAINLSNFTYYADALPIAWPNLGPEIFSAWCGCGYTFGETTAWSEPCIHDWETDHEKGVFDNNHPLFKVMIEFTQKLLEYARGKFIVGITDFHAGGDHIAALRDPQNLAFDMIDNIEYVKKKLESSKSEYFQVYDIFYNILKAENMPITSWIPIINDGKFYIPSNDFSCMISKDMFDEIFLPGIIHECKFYERSIYHLDGPGALRHLDSLLDIKELDAIQWVCGEGNEGYAKWVDVYQRIQNAGKAIQMINLKIEELPMVFETLKPEGVWFDNIIGINDQYTADEVIKSIAAWK